MRVLLTADPVGGVWTFALELSAWLAREGVAVTLATLGAPLTSIQRCAAGEITGLELEESSFRLEWMPEPWADLERAGRWLLRLEREHRPDVIHLNHLAHADLPWRAPVLVTGHSCVASWWEAVHGTPLPQDWAGYRRCVTRSLRAADCVAAPTGTMLMELQRRYGPLPHVAVVPNGRDPALFQRAGRKEPLVLCAGRLWDAAKNVHALVSVAPLLDWPVCLAGETVSPDGSQARIGGANLRLLGPLAPRELAFWHARAAIYALPARYEPFGLTVLEAALCGCALLLGDIPSLREVWGDAACYVAPDDRSALRGRLAELIASDATRTELAARAVKVAARLSPASTARGYLRLYRKLTAPPVTHAPSTNAPPRMSEQFHPPSQAQGCALGRAGCPDPAPLKFIFFTHSLVSDWNHGNAHFLRGVASELIALGHGVRVLEPLCGWSLRNLRREQGNAAVDAFNAAFPRLRSTFYDPATLDLDRTLEGADVVIAHEWNPPGMIAELGRRRALGGGFKLLFHDTHHRIVSAPEQMRALDLSHYDGVLAFGEALRSRYERLERVPRAWTWHEAADTRVFRPLPKLEKPLDLTWVGNWGDGERSRELTEFLIDPVRELGLRARIYGVRYPAEAIRALGEAGIGYGGWVANYRVPGLLACARSTVHVPRRFYREQLPGIPTIRVFEALACRIPLVTAPWQDSEGLFAPGRDYLVARDGAQMRQHLKRLLDDPPLAQALAERGYRTVLRRHTCAHRVQELLGICRQLGAGELSDVA